MVLSQEINPGLIQKINSYADQGDPDSGYLDRMKQRIDIRLLRAED